MNGSLARRVALRVSAFALLAAVASSPSTASAQVAPPSLFPPAPPTSTPTPRELAKPDIKVTALGVVHDDGGNGAYAFRLQNVGQGQASALTITRNVVVKRNDGKFVRTDVLPASHEVSLRPDQAITIELPCAAAQHQYCDVAVVRVEVSGPDQDADPTNNQSAIFDDIRGR